MATVGDAAELNQQLLANAWQDARQSWTDGGAVRFDQHHVLPISGMAREHSDALHRLTALLIEAERATAY